MEKYKKKHVGLESKKPGGSFSKMEIQKKKEI